MRVRIRQCRSLGRRILSQAGNLLFLTGAVALGFCAFVFFEAKYFQVREEHELERSLSLPGAANVPENAAPSRLEIPGVGISVMVHEGVSARSLRTGAGHIPGTALPGDSGNIGIAAHRDSYFRDLRKVRINDTILLTTLAGTYRYSVDSVRVVSPEDREVLAASHDPVITLVTCYPFYYIGAAPQRYVVRGRRVGFSR